MAIPTTDPTAYVPVAVMNDRSGRGAVGAGYTETLAKPSCAATAADTEVKAAQDAQKMLADDAVADTEGYTGNHHRTPDPD